MLISEKLNKAMNEQIGHELAASGQYLNIAAYFDVEALPEMAAFFYRQSDEERMHALKFAHYIAEAGGEVSIPPIPAADQEIPSAEAAAEMSLDWEMQVTDQINNLMNVAKEEGDHIAQNFLRWFVDEQLEEVSTMDELLSVIRRAGPDGLLFVEQYLVRHGDPHAEGG